MVLMSSRDSKSKDVAHLALLISLALVFSYVEAIIPFNPGIPGVKLGVANIVTVITLYMFGNRDAFIVIVIRVLIAGLLFNGVFGACYAMAGAAVSLTGMVLLRKTGLFSPVGVSMAGGVLHNLGQLLVAAALIEDMKIFFYFPVLMFSGIIAGIAVGAGSVLILARLKKSVLIK